ncbi:hypothetical protein P3X46_003058 [Hevea brasiliensis]|uniref:Uncharacterized protein n=1 Tax=Hevea brasiliensis TaxID=3981 RepID=A0ABQ9N9X2_HEVBR|nr:hypothetical protein P3X46_003058 [Hevea brasiliensis]
MELREAARILDHEEEWINKGLLLNSLQRGPVSPSKGSDCSHIPKGGACIKGMHFAGHARTPPPLLNSYPYVMVPVGMAAANYRE